MEKKEDLEMLMEVFDNTPIGLFVLDNDGRVLMMNLRQEKFSKIDRSEVLGHKFHQKWKSLFDKNAYHGKYMKMLKTGSPFSISFHENIPEFYQAKLTGFAYGCKLPSGKGYILLHEISEEMKRDKHSLEKLSKQLIEANEFLKNLFNSSPNAVITTNEKGLISSINSTGLNLFGFDRNSILWKSIEELFVNLKELKNIEKNSLAGKAGIEIDCKNSDGKVFPVRLQFSNLMHAKKKQKTKLFIITDITHLRKVELSLDERLKFETLLSELSATFINLPINKIDIEITKWLRSILEFLNVEMGALYQDVENDGFYYLTHSYAVNKDKKALQNLSFLKNPTLFENIKKGESTIISELSKLQKADSEEMIALIKYGIKSILCVPMLGGGKVIGALCLATKNSVRNWQEDLIKRLKLVGETFANALLRKKSEETIKIAYTEIQKLKDKLEAERNYLLDEIKLEHNFENIIGHSRSLQHTLYKVEQISTTDATALVLGETGTGKELIARAIHNRSKRKNRALIKINCATLPANLIESELFGHERGAFTGAQARQLGRFELANGGTIFLDEIGELPLELQPKLLRVLQENEFERLGSSKTIKVDVRVIVATNRDLEKEVENGKFRNDLWYRLNVFPITIPPLRKRKDDIRLLTKWFLNISCRKMKKEIKTIPNETMEILESYSWPGNVRELENTIEGAVINSRGNVLELVTQLHSQIKTNTPDLLIKPLSDIEKEHIIKALKFTNWVIEGKNRAAFLLGLTHSTMRFRMKKHGIKRP